MMPLLCQPNHDSPSMEITFDKLEYLFDHKLELIQARLDAIQKVQEENTKRFKQIFPAQTFPHI